MLCSWEHGTDMKPDQRVCPGLLKTLHCLAQDARTRAASHWEPGHTAGSAGHMARGIWPIRAQCDGLYPRGILNRPGSAITADRHPLFGMGTGSTQRMYYRPRDRMRPGGRRAQARPQAHILLSQKKRHRGAASGEMPAQTVQLPLGGVRERSTSPADAHEFMIKRSLPLALARSP